MPKPTAKLFGHVVVEVAVWIDPDRTDASLDSVLDNVGISIRNAADSVVKELDCPDLGIEVLVK